MSTPAVVLEAARERRRRFAGNNVLVIGCGVIIGLAVLLAAFGPLLAPHDPDAANLGNAYVGPVAGHLAAVLILSALLLGILVPLDLRLLRRRVLGD